jgi:hypothetical protein
MGWWFQCQPGLTGRLQCCRHPSHPHTLELFELLKYNNKNKHIRNVIQLLCSPVFVPKKTGGVIFHFGCLLCEYILVKLYTNAINSLCSPVLVPHMTGGVLPDGPVSEKVSVRHSVAMLIALPPAAMLPPG